MRNVYTKGVNEINKMAIGLRLVFIKKTSTKIKDRIAAKSFTQHFDVDFSETFSPAVR